MAFPSQIGVGTNPEKPQPLITRLQIVRKSLADLHSELISVGNLSHGQACPDGGANEKCEKAPEKAPDTLNSLMYDIEQLTQSCLCEFDMIAHFVA